MTRQRLPNRRLAETFELRRAARFGAQSGSLKTVHPAIRLIKKYPRFSAGNRQAL
jgi:hypothetical protein